MRTKQAGNIAPKFWDRAGDAGWNVCSKNNPKPPEAKGKWAHENVVYRNGDQEFKWRCLDCGARGTL